MLVVAASSVTLGSTLKNFEVVDASTYASAVTITGTSSVETIDGTAQGDLIDGGKGADTIVAGLGSDTVTYHGTEASIDGGTGDTDVLVVAANSVTLGSGIDNFEVLDASSHLGGVTMNGSNSAEAFTGTSSADTIHGGGGDDVIDGHGGADRLFGDAGNDTFLIDGSSLSLISVDGGSSTEANTVKFSAFGAGQDTQLATALTSVQVLDFTAANVDANLSLSGQQIASISGEANAVLNFKFNAGDSLSFQDNPLNIDETVIDAHTTLYTVHDETTHQVIAKAQVMVA